MPIERWKISVSGIVQGVGFRPFVYRLAKERSLVGFVANTSEGVAIEAQGQIAQLDDFLAALRREAPPLAQVGEIVAVPIPLSDDGEFALLHSTASGPVSTLISPDVAVCDACLAEIFSPPDRRFRYPFINCTNCGPRYTIVERIPYDRPHTTMRGFTMCPPCQREYDDPADRRFHAQPNCCPDCGPQLSLLEADGQQVAERDEALDEAVRRLAAGEIVAVKGVGGFHLAVDAANSQAVSCLRQRKGREAKPLAIMVADLSAARKICRLEGMEEQALTSQERPIVLAAKKEGHGLAEEVAPGYDQFGLMLPYAPLHYLLLAGSVRALIMTSGNRSEEPICIENHEAVQRLGGIADCFLVHDRGIHLACDDSLVALQDGMIRQIRRSRGFAPKPIKLAETGDMVLGVGAELKNTVCLLKGNQGFCSQHIGDLKNLEAYRVFQQSLGQLQALFEISPALIVHDLHPQYLSSRWAEEQKVLPTLAVQHHHAHLAACLAENRQEGPAIGIILDGAGYGSDRTIWGGEVLLGDARGYERFAALEALPLPGGDAAVQAPWRTALSYLHAAYGADLPDLPFMTAHECGPILSMVEKGVNSPLTSSCGRLFDAVAAMSGGRQTIQYEAQAAIELMQAAGRGIGDKGFPCEIYTENDIAELSSVPARTKRIPSVCMLKISVGSLIREVAQAVQAGMAQSEISRRFHGGLVAVFTRVAEEARRREKISTVALSGGVFQNRLLLEGMNASLGRAGFKVLMHTKLPCNDGCISLGQAVIGREALKKR
ncbi:MAG: carbamoyltransferase HypF [Proteobacteria bacterium]|nr:carbamoyltransferase HypF [Pseudomonadota bacterium]MBU1547595.1 carbamoyltransferase HypF [Pseudomonadota bacterium]MBU2619220.1 carbamoyltransferase HypF [Pseudomonadota bacterium]